MKKLLLKFKWYKKRLMRKYKSYTDNMLFKGCVIAMDRADVDHTIHSFTKNDDGLWEGESPAEDLIATIENMVEILRKEQEKWFQPSQWFPQSLD